MNDDFRLKLVKIRDEKVAHLNELQSIKMQGPNSKCKRDFPCTLT